MTYSDLKFALSDRVCDALSPVSPDLFVAICPRFLDGFIVTLELLVLATILGFFLAVTVAFARLSGIPALALPANAYAYTSEIFRGGLVNVPDGQMEAALSIGMPWLGAMRRIMLPQAIRTAWPAYGNEIVLLMKGSALVSTITVMDLMGQTRTVFARSFDLEVYLYSALLYLVLAGLITLLFGHVERHWR